LLQKSRQALSMLRTCS